MRITFKLNDRERGLASVCAGPRGSKIRVDGKDVGSIFYVGPGLGVKRKTGWAFTLYNPYAYVNTSSEPVATEEEAKSNARAMLLQAAK